MPTTFISQTSSSPFAQQGMGALAACLLAGSCVQDMVEDPELGMLLVSGHADVLSAKVRMFLRCNLTICGACVC